MIPSKVMIERASRFFFKSVFTGLFVFFIFLTSCEEESSFIGLEIQPPTDRLSVKLSANNIVNAFTFKVDSVKSDNFSIQLLGEINDPVFGFSKADFFSKMSMGLYRYNFGDNPEVDSMFLYFQIAGIYGDAETPHLINVYELTDTIYYDSSYYNNLDPSAFFEASSLIASHLYTPTNEDTLIKIPITDALFRERFVNIDSTSRDNELNFQKFFPGIYVTAEKQNDPGSILSLNLISLNSRMVMYFRNDSDTLQFNYFLGSLAAKVNLFRHDYSGTEFYTNLNQTTIQDSVIYIQSMGGLMAKLDFSDLAHWRDSVPVAINKARIIFPVEEADMTGSDYNKPVRLILLAKDENGNFKTITDYDYGSAYFGGTYSLDSKSYNFNITNQVQKFVQGSLNEIELYLLVSEIGTTANRTVLTSGNHSNPVRLEITYHKY
jgi:hypothetical protein